MNNDKKKYYKIKDNDGNWWVCSEQDFRNGIVEWLNDYENLKISIVWMTEKKFESLPEFQG